MCQNPVCCLYDEEVARLKLYMEMLGLEHLSIKSEKHVLKASNSC
jgi:hypothetical protein